MLIRGYILTRLAKSRKKQFLIKKDVFVKGIEMEPGVNPHFLLVVNNPVAKRHYVERLENAGATCKIIEGEEEIYSVQQQDEFHGLMLDVRSVLRLPVQHRAVIKEYSNALPTLKHFFHPETNNLVVNYSSLDGPSVNKFEEFVHTCARLPARMLRREPRYNLFLNVVLKGQLTHITNISRRGSYILTTDETLAAGDEISITIEELSDHTPLRCVVRRKVEWGSRYQAAGVGVEFVDMTQRQHSEFDALLQGFNARMESILSKWDEFRDDPSQHLLFLY